jgi:Tol biopolymer transport system component
LGLYSDDGSLMAYPDRRKGVAVVERLADGQTWEIDTQERPLNFRPDGQGLLWVAYDEDAPRDNRTEQIWLADPDGSNARMVYNARRTSPVAWLPDERLLMTRRLPGNSDRQLFALSLRDLTQTELFEGPRMRGMALSPDRRHLVYYVTFEEQPAENGVWLLDLQNPAEAPKKLPFFGTYQWRDNEHLIYIPFEPETGEHNFFEYDIVTGQSRALSPGGTGLTIANNDWEVSPDGSKIALLAAVGTDLDGIWVLDIE